MSPDILSPSLSLSLSLFHPWLLSHEWTLDYIRQIARRVQMHANEFYVIRETDVENCISEVHLRARVRRTSLLKRDLSRMVKLLTTVSSWQACILIIDNDRCNYVHRVCVVDYLLIRKARYYRKAMAMRKIRALGSEFSSKWKMVMQMSDANVIHNDAREATMPGIAITAVYASDVDLGKWTSFSCIKAIYSAFTEEITPKALGWNSGTMH